MWEILKSFVTANLLRILAILAASAMVAGILFGARQAGKSAERVDQLTRQIKGVKRAEKIRRGVADDHRDGVVPDRVRKFYID